MAKQNTKKGKSTKKTLNSADLTKKFAVQLYIELIASILFSLFTLSFHGDISLLAFPIALIYTAITVYVSYFKNYKPRDGKKCIATLKLVQYLPFVLLLSFILRRAGENGTAFWYDLISVILWIVVFVFSLTLSNLLNDKHIKALTEDWSIPLAKRSKKIKGSRFLFEIVDWIDALVQAVFMVLLIQIFILQLYVIPTESMVPTFLVKDRVAVSKLASGPKFPLTDVGLPTITKYKRGDIVVVRNPHYKMDRKSEVKTVVSQLIYMLTFTTVNTNKDEYGLPKADPLVKRVAGEQGEQLVMQDGVLYSRTKDNPVFTPVEADEKIAVWDLSTIPLAEQRKVERFPLSSVPLDKRRTNLRQHISSHSENYNMLIEFENDRKNYDLAVAEFNANELAATFRKLAYKDNLAGKFELKDLNEYSLFTNLQDITNRLLCQEGGADWFEEFMTSWTDAKNEKRDVYSESNFRLNVMTKMAFGNLVVRYAQLMRDGVASSLWRNDEIINENYILAEKLNFYLTILDLRNMPVFPPNDEFGNPQYIPKNCFFMMGENRFNSLDFRHSDEEFEAPLTNRDPLSVTYLSQMKPQYINQKYILGKPKYRLWPLNRLGSLHN